MSVSIRRHDEIALVIIDNPPVNATSQAVRQGLLDAVEKINADPAVKAGVIGCAGKTFIAGGDIREFGKPPLLPHLPDVLQAIEDSGKPLVAAIHGTALGGGLETALACHARVMAADALVGLPEVKLGLVPGAGGTQRLPRLVGMLPALDLVASGRQVKAQEALSLGLVDVVVSGDVFEAARAQARKLIGKDLRRAGRLEVPACDQVAFAAARAQVDKKARGQIAPGVAAGLVAAASALPFAEGIARERKTFFELMRSDQSRALRYVFAAEREVARVARLEGVAPRPVEKVGVIGAGTMGAGIAVALVDGGYDVRVVETSAAAVDAGVQRIEGLWARPLKSGKLTQAQFDQKRARAYVSADFSALADCDLIIEAAFEDMAVKQDIFSRLGALARPGAVLATNTSALDVNAIAAFSGRAADVIGLHFFSPAHVMRLVEVVEGGRSSADAVATGVAVAKRLKKLPVVCGVCDGFVGNRMLAVWRPVAEMFLEAGALPQDVDGALEAYGFAMGPFAVSDLAGLDIAWARRKRLAATRDPNERYASTVADRLCDLGRFGQKTGAGWYVYPDGKRTIDPVVSELVEKVSAEKGFARKTSPAEDIQRLVRAAMINEGAKILSEGIVGRALDVDMVLVHGYGYPAWRGGPMFEADAIGLECILADIEALRAFAGPAYEPAALIQQLADSGGTFGELAPGEAAPKNSLVESLR
ncbi:3-hydroxyacyl-CoA dehydrogenase [Rhodoblastus sphagnicola]|uniref:3-hydroxyacyl-CoA dehydrogenase NAD-binding domain-containing protein n=1 Tax=Rhodoblastus sphagnicola TaxID=333368 RepID=UPI00181FF870|nr:3-hydroxyacyl-CoA dehydrogenase NAD-binding domain-containing protein [Rhodoblastus sphagnicola]MBB4199258.1 3-hydroxyacyl-CoA dehydrogenase [Rhodoblastus sphagnicola]